MTTRTLSLTVLLWTTITQVGTSFGQSPAVASPPQFAHAGETMELGGPGATTSVRVALEEAAIKELLLAKTTHDLALTNYLISNKRVASFAPGTRVTIARVGPGWREVEIGSGPKRGLLIWASEMDLRYPNVDRSSNVLMPAYTPPSAGHSIVVAKAPTPRIRRYQQSSYNYDPFPSFSGMAGYSGYTGFDSAQGGKTVYVNGYFRNNGTYVAPYMRRPPGY
jgi:hypothetical protein